MREFLIYLRKARTKGDFSSLASAGRLDIFHQCIVQAVYKAHKRRFDVKIHGVLHGAPEPVKHIEISGEQISGVSIDEQSWCNVLRKVLSGKTHQGITVDRKSMQEIVREKYAQGYKIFVLEEKGKLAFEEDLTGNVLFVLGDHIGLPKNDERFVLRYGKKISLGKQPYLASTCIAILNFIIDVQEAGIF